MIRARSPARAVPLSGAAEAGAAWRLTDSFAMTVPVCSKRRLIQSDGIERVSAAILMTRSVLRPVLTFVSLRRGSINTASRSQKLTVARISHA